MQEYETFSISLQCAWVRRMQEGVGNQWMTIPSFYLGKVGGPFLFDCNYDINLLSLNSVPAFYIDRGTQREYSSKPLRHSIVRLF